MFMRKNIIVVALAVLVCFVFSACASKTTTNKDINTTKNAASNVVYPLKVVDSYKRTVTIEKEPKRIITIAPNVTEAIYALGKGSSVVGRSNYDDYPNEVLKVLSVGDLLAPSIEKIVELKPDVVLTSTLFNKDVIKKLEKLNIKVIVLSDDKNFNGVYNTMFKLGQVVNAGAKAESITSEMKKKVAYVTTKVSKAKKPTVYYIAGFGKSGDFTAGKDTFIGNMIEMAGGKNAADDVIGWKYSLEKLVQKDPDVLICSNLYDSKKSIEVTNGYKNLKAVRNGKLLEIDENIIVRQGPRLADGLEAIAKIVHPELFK
ncbi:ABC transporter substrate-binding protein [Clostridium psychrophilum]|uniref:ABC transporter substrate-binding protein n=1 Tax=Clostridium psychrophilum TaxID=132926 RepID=UPI001C0D295F|nr:ABC transporter substrate-binding protein [Clostridium psychrophilum]MBU3182860.1 ABC transporter substrate-binding protein [Clostridium psychrophilum]